MAFLHNWPPWFSISDLGLWTLWHLVKVPLFLSVAPCHPKLVSTSSRCWADISIILASLVTIGHRGYWGLWQPEQVIILFLPSPNPQFAGRSWYAGSICCCLEPKLLVVIPAASWAAEQSHQCIGVSRHSGATNCVGENRESDRTCLVKETHGHYPSSLLEQVVWGQLRENKGNQSTSSFSPSSYCPSLRAQHEIDWDHKCSQLDLGDDPAKQRWACLETEPDQGGKSIWSALKTCRHFLGLRHLFLGGTSERW